MKVLFVSDFILAEEQGAKKSTIAHYESLKDIFGKHNVDVIALNSTYHSDDANIVCREEKQGRIDKLKNILVGRPFLLNRSAERKILELCTSGIYSLIFIDHSIYGTTVKKIKKVANIPVICYFHGIMQYQNDQLKAENKISHRYGLICKSMKENEGETVKYADKCLILNERDNRNLKKYYGVKSKYLFPVYYTDTANIDKNVRTDEFTLLFVGGYFWPNIQGITWFIDNVMPKVKSQIMLYIVGHRMEELREDLTRNNVTVVGSVENLDEWYNKADLVVGPIFKGEGMKTKTCEALMYGKRYLGTDEALEGYEGLNDYRCNSANEFIQRINKFCESRPPKFSGEMRKLYEDKYSPQMAKKLLLKAFSDAGVQNISEE